MAYVHMTNVEAKMKYWIDQDRRDVEFKVGNLALLEFRKEKFYPPIDIDGTLECRFEGMFKVLEKIGNVTYQLELLNYHMRDHHQIFHISQFNPCRIDPGGSRWPPTFSNWFKTIFWQLTIFSSFSVLELSRPF
jgi:hypothetical protein